VDEAQLIPLDTFEEIRLLLNFQLNDRFLLTTLLIGQPELADVVHKLKQLDQRVAIRYHINPLTEDETAEYIKYRMGKAGREDSPFTEEAVERIFHYAEGIPRKINNVCDLALLVGFTSRVPMIDERLIDQVIRDSL